MKKLRLTVVLRVLIFQYLVVTAYGCQFFPIVNHNPNQHNNPKYSTWNPQPNTKICNSQKGSMYMVLVLGLWIFDTALCQPKT